MVNHRLFVSYLQPMKMKGYTYPIKIKKFTNDDIILYSLSIGFGKDPFKEEDAKYLVESDLNFQGFPTMSVIGLS